MRLLLTTDLLVHCSFTWWIPLTLWIWFLLMVSVCWLSTQVSICCWEYILLQLGQMVGLSLFCGWWKKDQWQYFLWALSVSSWAFFLFSSSLFGQKKESKTAKCKTQISKEQGLMQFVCDRRRPKPDDMLTEGPSTPETNWNTSRIKWTNCHTFQWQFVCAFRDEFQSGLTPIRGECQFVSSVDGPVELL